MFRQKIFVTLAATLLTLAGTGSIMAGPPNRGSGGPGGSDALLQTEIEDLVYMREEEKLARDSYLVLGKEWGLTIFSNIAESEQRHMDALKQLLVKFSIPDPVKKEKDIGTYLNPDLQTLFNELMDSGLLSMMNALNVGGAIEETDILDLQHAIERTVNEDIITTYESLLCGSRNHLRAFVGQIELYGEVYEPILLSDEEFNAIVDFPTERDCGGNRRSKGKTR